jgi:hypothetical protein
VRGSIDLRTLPPTGSLANERRYLGELSGSFDPDGVLSLQGPTRLVLPSGAVVDSGVIRDWRTRLVNGVQEGTFSHVFSPNESWETAGTVMWNGLVLKK